MPLILSIISRFDLFFILVDDCNEVTDYAIARRIVDLHAKMEDSIDRVYEPADIARLEASDQRIFLGIRIA